MNSERQLVLDENRLQATKRACAEATTPWAYRFWGNVYEQLKHNMHIRNLYDQLGGSERSPLNPIQPIWNHF